MKSQKVFESIKEEFCSLWSFKLKGETLEIITPYSTTTSKFVSIFLTQRNKEFIVSDGGWLLSEMYDNSIDFDDEMFAKAFYYFENQYEIKSIEATSATFYYKKTYNAALVPSLVYEMANFISAVVSSSQVQFQNLDEKETKKLFEGHARSYINSLVPKDGSRTLMFRKALSDDDNLKSIKFSAISQYNNQLTLINYVTGSTIDYFANSIGKANIMFEVGEKSKFKKNIKNKIALIDDTAKGFDKKRLAGYLDMLETTTKRHNILWHQRELLKKYF